MIASKTEIKALAFSNNFDIEAVKDNLIQVVEWEQVLPLLGTSLYDDVVANHGSYTILLREYLKPFIAYGVKAYVSKPNHIKTGNKGAQTAQGSNEQIASIQMAKREASKMVDSYKKLMVKYLDDSSIALWEGEPTNTGIINKIIII